MRRKKTVERMIWNVKRNLLASERDSTTRFFQTGFLMALQWTLGTQFDDEGNCVNTAISEIVPSEDEND